MSAVLVIVHVIVCVVLIAVVLLQRGKGAEIGAVFGGGASSTVFGSRGAGNFLTKLTTGAAVVYMLTSLSLSYVWTQDAENRLFSDEALESEAAQPLVPADENLFEEIGTVPANPEPAAEAAVEEAAAPQATLEEGSLPPLAEPGDAEQAP
jgi:preprotein translocase subunit SecG